MKIDWSKAPEGATHYWQRNGHFYVKIREDFFVAGQQNYGPVNSPDSWVKSLIPRPFTTWNGEGLPPVGTECEYQRNDVIYKQAWVAVTPCYIGESITVLKHSASGNEFTEMTTSCVYRPIRTAEQIAAEERDKAIEEIAGLLSGLWSSEREAAEFIYRAGYRKVEVKP